MTIVGNQTDQENNATKDHEEAKGKWKGLPSRVIIGIASLAIAIYLFFGFSDFSFFSRLILSGVLIWGGGKLATMKEKESDENNKKLFWLWPSIVRATGWIYLALAIISSGFYGWISQTTNNIEGAIACNVDSISTSCLAKKKVEAAAVAAAHKVKFEAAKRKAAIAAAEAESARLVQETVEANRTQAVGQPCAGRWTGLKDCESVTFGVHTKYDRTAKVGECLMVDPPNAATRTHLGGNDWRYVPHNARTTIRFFDLPVGQTALGAKCG